MAVRASDQITVVDLTDGYSVYLSSYAHIFNGNTSNALAGSTTVKVTAMVGPDVVPCTVNVASITKPTGINISKDSHATTPTLTISATTSFTTPGIITIPVEIDGITIVQTMAVSFAKTGATGTAGVSSTIVGLKNEAQMIVTDSAGKTVGSTNIQVDFYGYVGASRAAVSASVGSLPTGITTGTNNPGTTSADGVLTLSVANNSTIGGADSGTIPITLTCNGISRTLIFAWSKAKAGVNGTDGKDALILEIISSAGLIFKNSQVSTTFTANVYKGGVLLTAPQVASEGVVKWYKNGSYLGGKDGLTLTVGAGDVTDSATFDARLDG